MAVTGVILWFDNMFLGLLTQARVGRRPDGALL